MALNGDSVLGYLSLLRSACWGYDQEDPQLQLYSAEMGIVVAVPDRQRLLSRAREQLSQFVLTGGSSVNPTLPTGPTRF